MSKKLKMSDIELDETDVDSYIKTMRNLPVQNEESDSELSDIFEFTDSIVELIQSIKD